MSWGLFRVVLFSAAFLLGLLFASPQSSVVFAPDSPQPTPVSTDRNVAESVVIACEGGEPGVYGVGSATTAVDVTCREGHMRVIRLAPSNTKEMTPSRF
jgi:hypothetical protein